jgi:hypothetical protein
MADTIMLFVLTHSTQGWTDSNVGVKHDIGVSAA